MVTINDAIALAAKNDPDLIPHMCTEYDELFCFFMANKKNEAIGNGCTYVVNKNTGECGWKSMFADKAFRNAIPIKIYSEEEIIKLRGA